ncbi:MG2 domain protein [Bacteroidales bacterium Barb4]|nr:MG2 domain protein [Bacteroidales bacterium Barb4]
MVKRMMAAALLMCCMGLMVVSCKAGRATDGQTGKTELAAGKNTPQAVKEMISQMKGELETDEDRLPDLIKEAEGYIAVTADAAAKAVLHSMAAEMYHKYYEQNRYMIDRRTALSGDSPADIREWSGNLFTAKIKEHATLSLQPAGLLQQTPATLFHEILEEGKDAQALRPALYDFLAQRAAEVAPSEDMYKEWLAFRRAEGNEKAAFMVELDFLKYSYTSGLVRWDSARVAYKAALEMLADKYAAYDYSIEVRIVQADAEEERGAVYRLCKEGIAQYPDYERTAVLRNRLASMEQPDLTSIVPETVYPDSTFAVSFNYRNIKEAKISIHEGGKPVKERIVPLHPATAYESQDTVVHLSLERLGRYECTITAADGIKVKHTVVVSRLAVAARSLPSGDVEVLVTDYLSGKPVPQAEIVYFGGKRDELRQIGSLKTDGDGLAALPSGQKPLAFRAMLSGDTCLRLTNVYRERERAGEENRTVSLSLFTDRGIYRPGQTMFFKGIAFRQDKEKTGTVAGHAFSVALRDANGQEVSVKRFTTNQFGSFNGEFTLPKQGLTGVFTLSADDYASCQVSVEEYKRPTFAVEWLPMEEEVIFGDEVTLRGKVQTFSGVSLQSGRVAWRVMRRPFSLLTRGTVMVGGQVEEGTASLSADGTFAVSFRTEKIEWSFPWYCLYEVIADVTDDKGETQEARHSFPVGDASIVLSVDLPQQVEKTQVTATVSATLLAGGKTSAAGKFTIVPLAGEDYNYTEGKQAASGDFIAGKPLPQPVFSALPSGRYRIHFEAADSKGRAVKAEQDFILYARTDKQPPVFTRSWLAEERTSCLPGEEAAFIFGTSDKDAYILYELFGENKQLLSRRRIRLSNESRTFTFPFKAEYGDGVTASFTYAKKGELQVTQVPVTRKQPDRKLAFRTETFRDKLLPGGRERWRFRVMGSDSSAVSAEVLAAMYDKSLDKLLPFEWFFSPERSIRLRCPRFNEGEGFRDSYEYGEASVRQLHERAYQYDRLDWQGMMQNRYGRHGGIMMRSNAMMKATVLPEAMQTAMADDDEMYIAEITEESLIVKEQAAQDNAPSSAPSLRRNFNETAFFFPTLLTDEDGGFLIDFVVPESNTAWKLQALAHTKDLRYGSMTQTAVTSKPLMVIPNLPRFLREGDTVTLSALLTSQKDKETSGRARIEWFDPADGKTLALSAAASRPFVLPPNGQASLQWTADVPADIPLAGIRIIAETADGSDGEQHLIPVLPDRILVTESTPFYLSTNEERQIAVAPLQAGRQPFRLTLEMTANPVFYAVQALPALAAPDNDNILSWFASYYANTLAAHIAASNPDLQQAVNRWAADASPSPLLSNLEKNEELKSTLLQETPWVLDAVGETEQKHSLSLLFDSNRTNNLRNVAVRRLLDEQTPEGGWGWFKGFASDRRMTLSILKGMAQLAQLNAVSYTAEEKEMLARAVRCLDELVQKDYATLPLSAERIEYLLVRSEYSDVPLSPETETAVRFLTDKAEKEWEKLSLADKGRLALLAHRNGKHETATALLAWLRKTAVVSDEQGMFWPNNRKGADFFASPLDVHCLLMSAFAEIAPDLEETDRMKQWLLGQKRTQQWETVPATVNAIHALLLTGSDWTGKENTVTARWNKQTYNTADGEAATGYLKAVLDRPASSPSAAVALRKEGNAPAWGAVYNQYFTPLSQAGTAKGALSVDKQLILPASPLKAGDKLTVRLVIRTDRDMDYIMLKDQRAACLEPVRPLSGYVWQDGIGFYHTTGDISETFFIRHLPRGTFVFEYPAYIARGGNYSGGIATLQCLYAPEYTAYMAGEELHVANP